MVIISGTVVLYDKCSTFSSSEVVHPWPGCPMTSSKQWSLPSCLRPTLNRGTRTVRASSGRERAKCPGCPCHPRGSWTAVETQILWVFVGENNRVQRWCWLSPAHLCDCHHSYIFCYFLLLSPLNVRRLLVVLLAGPLSFPAFPRGPPPPLLQTLVTTTPPIPQEAPVEWQG